MSGSASGSPVGSMQPLMAVAAIEAHIGHRSAAAMWPCEGAAGPAPVWARMPRPGLVVLTALLAEGTHRACQVKGASG
jgi:hypothetical protein